MRSKDDVKAEAFQPTKARSTTKPPGWLCEPSSKPRLSTSALTSFSIDIEPQIMTRSVSGFERVDAEVGEQTAVLDQPGDATHARRDLAGGRAVVDEAAGRQLADQRVIHGLREQLFAIGKLGMVAAGMGQHDLLEFLISLGIADAGLRTALCRFRSRS